MSEHRHGGLVCEGSGQEAKTCNAWLDTKNNLLTCEAESKDKSLAMRASAIASAIEIEALEQTLKKKEEKIIVLEVLRLRLIMPFNNITLLFKIYRMHAIYCKNVNRRLNKVMQLTLNIKFLLGRV